MTRRGNGRPGASLVRPVGTCALSLSLLGGTTLAQTTDAELRQRAIELMTETPLIDGHNDLPWQLRQRVSNQLEKLDIASDLRTLERPTHTDLPRLHEGHVGAQFWSVYIPIGLRGGRPEDVQTVIEQIDVVHRMAAMNPDHLEIALTADDVERVFASGRIASLIGMEGGHSIGNSLAALRALYALGARYMTLTHSKNTLWADSGTDEQIHGGLTPFGEEVVREMNRLGMIVDLSHVSAETMHDALDVAEAAVIFSHSSARALCDHGRNVPDDVLRRLPENGGVVMITFVPSYLRQDIADHSELARAERERLLAAHPSEPEAVTAGMRTWREANPSPWATISDVADHIDHVREVAGIDHVGIGSDFDGIRSVPVGLEDVSKYPDLIAEMLRRGYDDEDVRKLLGLNVLRVMRDVERTAGRLRSARPASETLIDDLDGPPLEHEAGEGDG